LAAVDREDSTTRRTLDDGCLTRREIGPETLRRGLDAFDHGGSLWTWKADGNDLGELRSTDDDRTGRCIMVR
jgi:hypothetical protein